jgi:ABC-type branched-subunit amino acid transport system substrate-binding protein
MKVLQIAILLSISALLYSCSEDCPSPVINVPEASEVRIGVILPQTGDHDLFGIPSKAAFELAVADMKAELLNTKSNVAIKFKMEDDSSNPANTLAIMQRMHEQDSIDVFFGLTGSILLGGVIDYIDSENLFAVSVTSTSSQYAKDDNVFRFFPSDDVLSDVITKAFVQDEIKYLIPVSKDDHIACHSLTNFVTQEATSENITTSATIKYSVNTTDYSATVESIRLAILEAHNHNESNEIAVFLSSYIELVEIMELLDEEIFSTVKWYGGDAAYVDAIFESEKASTFADLVDFKAPTLTNNPMTQDKFNAIGQRIKSKIGHTGAPFGATAYDAAINLLTSTVNCRNAETSVLKEQFVSNANRYVGATGITELNENGDRKYATFNFDTPVNEGGAWKWQNVYTLTNR